LGKKKVGIRAFVFDERAALAQADYCDWIVREIKGAPKDNWHKPESSSPRLRKWFDDMRRSFPLIGDADPDDPYGTEYCFYCNVIDVIFAGSVGEEGVLQAWRLAGKHDLRLLVGEELLPRKAPKGKRNFHISVLDGGRPIPGIAPNMCFVVFDPDIAHVAPGKARTWILERLEAEPWSKDQSILTGDKLRRWIDLFAARNLDPLVSEMRFYRDLIFIRVDRKNDSSMLSPTMELSHKLNLPFEVYVDLG
jgi:hypothetical protein